MIDINKLLSNSANKKKVEIFRVILQVIGFAIFIYFGSQSTMYIILLSLPLAVLFGPVYCGWMCPRGFFQDIIGKAGRKVLGKRYNIAVPVKYHPYLMYFRYVLLIFVALSLLLSQFGIISKSVELFILEFLIGIMVVSILLSFFVDRAACKYFCKEGAAAGLVNFVSIKKIERISTLCNSCGICDNVCPMWIKVSKKDVVNEHSCISCFKCVQECPKGALVIKK